MITRNNLSTQPVIIGMTYLNFEPGESQKCNCLPGHSKCINRINKKTCLCSPGCNSRQIRNREALLGRALEIQQELAGVVMG